MSSWYTIHNIEKIDSPSLIVYPERVKENIRQLIQMAGNVELLRPHVKTNKIAEVCQLMLDAGITKFKCATIAEAEMLGSIQALDVLIASTGWPKDGKITTAGYHISKYTFYLYH